MNIIEVKKKKYKAVELSKWVTNVAYHALLLSRKIAFSVFFSFQLLSSKE